MSQTNNEARKLKILKGMSVEFIFRVSHGSRSNWQNLSSSPLCPFSLRRIRDKQKLHNSIHLPKLCFNRTRENFHRFSCMCRFTHSFFSLHHQHHRRRDMTRHLTHANTSQSLFLWFTMCSFGWGKSRSFFSTTREKERESGGRCSAAPSATRLYNIFCWWDKETKLRFFILFAVRIYTLITFSLSLAQKATKKNV